MTSPSLPHISGIQQSVWAPTAFVLEFQSLRILCYRNVSSRVTCNITLFYLLHQSPQERAEGNLKHCLIKQIFGEKECVDFSRTGYELNSFFAFLARGPQYMHTAAEVLPKEKGIPGLQLPPMKWLESPLKQTNRSKTKQNKKNNTHVLVWSWWMLLQQTKQSTHNPEGQTQVKFFIHFN